MIIAAGARGFDALGDPASPARMVADGWMFRTFYICQGSTLSTKITDRNRRAAMSRIRPHLNAGMGVLLNYEWAADRWTKGGATGRADGAWSAGLCDELGYPEGLPVLVSFDTDVSSATLRTAVAYGEGFAAGLGRRWRIGVYGELSIIAALQHVSILGWKVMASFWNLAPLAANPVVHIRQRRPTAAEAVRYPYVKSGGGWTLDVNDARLSFSAWGIEPEPVLPLRPAPGGVTMPRSIIPFAYLGDDDDMDLLLRHPNGSQYITDRRKYARQVSEEEAAHLRDNCGAGVMPDGNPWPIQEQVEADYILRIADQ